MHRAVVAQMVEHLAVNEVVPGSSPGDGVFSRNNRRGVVDQFENSTVSYRGSRYHFGRALSLVWLERRAHNSVVIGSNPIGPIFAANNVSRVGRSKINPVYDAGIK